MSAVTNLNGEAPKSSATNAQSPRALTVEYLWASTDHASCKFNTRRRVIEIPAEKAENLTVSDIPVIKNVGDNDVIRPVAVFKNRFAVPGPAVVAICESWGEDENKGAVALDDNQRQRLQLLWDRASAQKTLAQADLVFQLPAGMDAHRIARRVMVTLFDANVKFREVTGQHGSSELFIQIGIAPPQNVADHIFLTRWVIENSIQEESMLSSASMPETPAVLTSFVPRISTAQSRETQAFTEVTLPGGQQTHPGVAGAFGFYEWSAADGANTNPWREFVQVLQSLPSEGGDNVNAPDITRLD